MLSQESRDRSGYIKSRFDFFLEFLMVSELFGETAKGIVQLMVTDAPLVVDCVLKIVTIPLFKVIFYNFNHC